MLLNIVTITTIFEFCSVYIQGYTALGSFPLENPTPGTHYLLHLEKQPAKTCQTFLIASYKMGVGNYRVG